MISKHCEFLRVRTDRFEDVFPDDRLDLKENIEILIRLAKFLRSAIYLIPTFSHSVWLYSMSLVFLIVLEVYFRTVLIVEWHHEVSNHPTRNSVKLIKKRNLHVHRWVFSLPNLREVLWFSYRRFDLQF